MWDVTLGQPCVRHIVAHTRRANAVSLYCDILSVAPFILPLLILIFIV
jgi:hypothetical protein